MHSTSEAVATRSPVISYQVEDWSTVLPDMKPIFPLHWQEMALDKDKIALDLNFERYFQMETAEMLLVTTARDGEKLVGYFIFCLLKHLHYDNAGLMAYIDIYFLLPEYRTGGTGTKLLLFTEQSLRERGIKKAYMSTKLHQDHGMLLEKMGWNPTDRVYTKYLA